MRLIRRQGRGRIKGREERIRKGREKGSCSGTGPQKARRDKRNKRACVGEKNNMIHGSMNDK